MHLISFTEYLQFKWSIVNSGKSMLYETYTFLYNRGHFYSWIKNKTQKYMIFKRSSINIDRLRCAAQITNFTEIDDDFLFC